MRLIGSDITFLDDKGRTAMPARFREAVAAISRNAGIEQGPYSLMVVPWFDDQCLRAFALPTFDQKVAQFEAQLAGERAFERGRDETWLERTLYGDARELTPDGSGRVLMPSELRVLARLEREVMWKGMRDCIEIWNPTVYEEARVREAARARAVLANYSPPAAGSPLSPIRAPGES